MAEYDMKELISRCHITPCRQNGMHIMIIFGFKLLQVSQSCTHLKLRFVKARFRYKGLAFKNLKIKLENCNPASSRSYVEAVSPVLEVLSLMITKIPVRYLLRVLEY